MNFQTIVLMPIPLSPCIRVKRLPVICQVRPYQVLRARGGIDILEYSSLLFPNHSNNFQADVLQPTPSPFNLMSERFKSSGREGVLSLNPIIFVSDSTDTAGGA